MASKKGQFDVVELFLYPFFKAFSINLNAQDVNGMTHFSLNLLIENWWKYMNGY